MLDSDILIQAAYNYGREKALELREEAPTLTDTEVIDQELFIPTWHEGFQPLGAVVQFEGQVYRVIQEHDSTGNWYWNPSASPALFSICHTKNPFKAKPWVSPYGTSGMYYLDECYIDGNTVWKQIYDGENVYDAVTLPERWVEVDLHALSLELQNEEENNNEENNGNNEIDNNEQNNEENNNQGNGNENNGSGEDEIIEDNPDTNEIIDEWVQPSGAHDAYPVGAKVFYNDKYWINTSPANIYAPGVYGWDEIIE